MTRSGIPDVLRERASLQPNDTAFTFVDYQQDWEGVAEDLTWSQVYRRTRNIANELRLTASPGDRVVILADQSLEYVTGFLGALEAGLTAVPLSVPDAGAHDERVEAVLRDTSPSVILTTSSVVDNVTKYAQPKFGESTPALVEVDKLDLDARKGSVLRPRESQELAYLQYTSGSTRSPAGVMISHRNLSANFEQVMADYFHDHGGLAPPEAVCASWLPLYHDMGLFLGVAGPILGGYRSVLTSPIAFLQRPARWMHLLSKYAPAYTGAPNFAFELTTKRTTDEDMAGHDLGQVMCILSGAERIHEATVRRFTQRFARFNLPESVIRPSYGLAEATVYVATRRCERDGRPEIVHFESEKLSAGHAKRCVSGDGTTGLVSYGVPQSPAVKIVNPDTNVECPAGTSGEIWVQGENVAMGYWKKPEETEHTFDGHLAKSSADLADKPWLRTGDLGFFSDGELFIMGRIKDLLIVYGRNHYPDDIEATAQEISGGRVAAVSVPEGPKEKLVVIIELKKRGDSHEETMDKLLRVKREVASALSKSHGLGFADLVLVAPGSIPITTSGKIRRSSCVEYYQRNQFTRLDASA